MDKNMKNMWSQYSKHAPKHSPFSFLLAGLGLLAFKAYYYGILSLIQLILDTMPLNSIKYPIASLLKSTDKVLTLKFPSFKIQLSTMYRQERMKSLQKLPIEICKVSDYQ